MKRLRRLPALIMYLGMMNFLLFFISSFLLGGDGLNGKIEAGHYYLGNHGDYTEVIYPVYWFSRAQGILFFISWPFVMVATLIVLGVGGSERNDKTMRATQLGSAYGWLDGIFSLLFDSWRKPNIECFARSTPSECIQELLTLPDWIVRDSLKKKTFNLIWGGQHFDMSQSSSTNWYWRGVSIVLHGHFHSTPHGTYIKAWYRWSALDLLFLSIFAMLGLAIPVAGLEWLIVKVLGVSQVAVVEFFAPIWPIWSRVSIVIGLLLLIKFSSWWGRHHQLDLARLVKEALTPDSLAHPTRSSRDIRQLT
ncbi:hypothetical protein TFLX_00217 [Thermoflexales bacterium]|nr:hypothetical protein TFLX_00217 [Thermoflexales bacterium]